MKICSPQLGVSPHSSLGGEIYDYQTLKGFTQKGVKVFVYLPKNRPYDKSLKNFYVDYCFMKHIFPPWIYSFISMPYLVRTYKREKFDFLRIHSPRFLGFAAIFFHLLHPKVPIIASQVTVDPSLLFYPIEWLTFRVSKKIIVQSDYMKSILIKKYKVSANKIAVTYGGQLDNPKDFKEVPKQARVLNNDTQALLFMGVLVKRKNPLFLVDIFEEVKKEIPNSKLVVIGNGPLKKNLVKKLKSVNLLDDSILIDYAYGEEKTYWLKRMNIFLMPSFDEGFGLAVTEAMSFAKPVITSDRAAFEEIITNGQNGHALPLKTDLWIKTILNLLKSPITSKKIGMAAQSAVQKRFNWSRTYNLNYRILLEMVK